MFIKKRTRPVTLRVMESLFYRMDLSKEGKKYYYNQISGHEGECELDSHTIKFSNRYPVLNDLNLEHRKNEFQIDALVIKDNTLHLYEVKNFKGDFFYENGKLRSHANSHVANPTGQSDRAESLLYNLVRELGYQYDVKENIVFIHPNFFMYNAPSDKNYLFLSQIESHLNQAFPYEEMDSHRDFIRDLLALNNPDYRAKQIPEYDYSDLRKGIYCPECFSFNHTHSRQNRICLDCGNKEAVVQAIYRSTEEFKLLFPDKMIKTSQIYDWCNQVYSHQRVYKALKTRYKKNGNTKSACYE